MSWRKPETTHMQALTYSTHTVYIVTIIFLNTPAFACFYFWYESHWMLCMTDTSHIKNLFFWWTDVKTFRTNVKILQFWKYFSHSTQLNSCLIFVFETSIKSAHYSYFSFFLIQIWRCSTANQMYYASVIPVTEFWFSWFHLRDLLCKFTVWFRFRSALYGPQNPD